MFINYSEVLIAQLLRQFLLNKVVVGLQLSVVLEMLTNLWYDIRFKECLHLSSFI